MIRDYTKEDHAMLCKWWKAWDWPTVAQDFLPETGVICNEIAAGFLYDTKTPMAWIEWIISDKEANAIQRSHAIDGVIEQLVAIAKARGFKVIWTSTNKVSLENRFTSKGFGVVDKAVTHLMKFLGE